MVLLAAPSMRSPTSLLAAAARKTGICGIKISFRYSLAAGDVKLVFCTASDRYKGKVGSKICNNTSVLRAVAFARQED